MSQILLLLRARPLSPGEISERLGLDASDVSRHLNSSSRRGLVRYDLDERRYALA
jgi:DNA-binding IclR family transcriptional regulator